MKHQPMITTVGSIIILLFSVAGAFAQEAATAVQASNVEATNRASMGTSFSYQGNLLEGGVPVNGNYDFRFTLWDSMDNTTGQASPIVVKEDVAVANGMFNVSLDFGAYAFIGEARYLQIEVRPGASSGDPTLLSPRQLISPIPHAIYATHANSLSAPDGYPLDPVYVDNEGMLHVRDGNAEQGRIMLENQQNGQWAQFNRWTNRFEILVSDGIEFATKEVGATKMTITSDGNIGIGTRGPATKLHVIHEPQNPNGGALVLGPVDGSNLRFGYDIDYSWIQSHGNRPLSINAIGNNVGIGTTAPVAKLDVRGRVRSSEVEITGGSDLAEPFEVNGQQTIEPGMVVAIDPDHPGQLRIADQAYDHTVAGVISGAGGISPGLTLRQEGTIAAGTYPVALTGRVYVWVDAAFGTIEPGDLLTTSSTPGYAMKVDDHDLSNGAILGKAMTKLGKDKGLVLALVSLQ